jgi:aspartate aminotransferase
MWVDVRPLLGRTFPDSRPCDSSAALARYLLEEFHVATVPGSAFGAEGYLRLSFATSLEDVEEGVARIAGAVDRLGS